MEKTLLIWRFNMENNIRNRIVRIIEENGIEIGNDGILENIDSIKFVSMLVSIEQEFAFEIPDEFLLIDNIPNVESISTIVENEVTKIHA